MKFKFIIAFVILGLSCIYSQVVSTIPRYATENDSITVIFNAAEGDAGLKGFNGTVYAYTGLITNKSLDLHDWKHVISSGWTDYVHQPVLTKIGTDLYKIVIGYPRKFYSVEDSSEHILKLAFVFKNADGSKSGRDVGGRDIFAFLYSSGINLVLNSPTMPQQFGDPMRSPIFAGQNDTVSLSISAVLLNTKLSSLVLYNNGNQIAQTTSDSLFYPFISANFKTGANIIKAVGTDTAGLADTLSLDIMINSPVQQASLPAGNEYGINYNNSTTVTLALYAPYKKFVYVLGDFNDWKVDPAYYMKEEKVTPDSVIWWLTITGLTPGQEYAFQYLVDGQLRIGDPYCEKVLDPSNDKYISSSTYPNLKPYPTGKTNEIVSVLQTAQSPYNWQDTSFTRPAKSNLVIYELLVRDFVSTHDYQTLTDTIGYFKKLGVNAIELMPIMEFEGNESWGYNPDFNFAPDKYYGTKSTLKKFVDLAHQNGIAIILDAPMNDIFGQSPLVRLYWDAAKNQPAADNPWVNPTAKHPYNVGYDFNYESSAFQYYINRFTKFWLTKYHVDGFRFDLAGGYTQNPNGFNNWENYDASRIANEEKLANGIWKVSPDAYVILEEFVNSSEEKVVANYGMMVWDRMNDQYDQASMGYSNPSWDLSGISYKSWGWNVPGLVGYMESHDEERMMYKNLQYGNSNGGYNIKDLGTALNRVKLCDAFFYTVPGPKMLWQFGELGYDISINNPCRVCNKPIKWEYYNDPNRHALYETTSALIKLKNEFPAFNSTNYSTNLSGAIKTINITDTSMNVAIIGNFDVVQRNGILNFQNTGSWYDYFSGDTINVAATQKTFSLAPGEFHIYTTKKLPTPEAGIITNINEANSIAVTSYKLMQNYPNPFNPTTVIEYQIPQQGLVSLKVFDILGREVATIVNGVQTAGTHSITFDGSKLSSGVYFYSLKTGNFFGVKKLILMK